MKKRPGFREWEPARHSLLRDRMILLAEKGRFWPKNGPLEPLYFNAAIRGRIPPEIMAGNRRFSPFLF